MTTKVKRGSHQTSTTGALDMAKKPMKMAEAMKKFERSPKDKAEDKKGAKMLMGKKKPKK